MTDTDTRAHPRYEIRVSADLTLQTRETITAVTRDLSLGGVGVGTERPLPEGARLTVELFVVVDDIEDETTVPLLVNGLVVWSRMRGPLDFLAGIQFVDLTAEQRAYLQQLVSAQAAAG
jgi:hypothetical protein